MVSVDFCIEIRLRFEFERSWRFSFSGHCGIVDSSPYKNGVDSSPNKFEYGLHYVFDPMINLGTSDP